MTDRSRPDVVALLERLVAVDTTNPGGDELAGLEVLAEALRDAGIQPLIDEYRPGNANLTGRLVFGTGRGPTVMLNSHVDVVPSGTGWSSEPHRARVDGDRLYARGAADAKGSLAAMLVALLELHADGAGLEGTVVFTAVGDEEGGSTGARALVKTTRADACIVGEPTGLRLLTAHKGSVRPVIEVRGVAAHAATPHNGANAIGGAALLVGALDALAEKLAERPHPLVGAPTLTPVLVTGGEAPNAVPERVRITIDRRLVPGETEEEALAQIGDVLGAFSREHAPLSAVIVDRAPTTGGPSETPGDAPLVLAARRALAAIGADPEPGGLVVNCDMTTFRGAGIPTVVLGPGTLEVMHARDEYVELPALRRAVDLYAAILRELLTPAR